MFTQRFTTLAATSSQSSGVPKSSSEIWGESARPTTRPSVAMLIVNQKDVRSTRRRWAGSGESK